MRHKLCKRGDKCETNTVCSINGCMDKHELKHCPFCGAMPDRVFAFTNKTEIPTYPSVSTVRCHNCLAEIKRNGDLNEAIKAWNTRNDDLLSQPVHFSDGHRR